MAEEIYRPGLEGVIAGETDVATVEQDSLAYRGYTIESLANGASFEEVAYLLLNDDLPKRDQLAEFTRTIDSFRKLPDQVIATIKLIPRNAPGMDVLRTAVSMCGHFDTSKGDDRAALVQRATHVLAVVPSIIAARLRLLDGKDPVDPKPGLSHAAQFLYMAFAEEPMALETKLIDLTLILYAEHELNASTFAARVCTSTLSDLYSAIVTGIGTLKGPLHGGANEEAMKLIGRFKSGDEARAWAEQAVANKEKIMGFGHRVYKNGDHRARILEPLMEDLARERNQQTLIDVYRAIRDVVWERKQIYMNVDYPCGPTYYLLGLPMDIYTPLFVASRVTGWAAHIIEQYTNNRIIRPRSRYTGPGLRDYVPMDKR
jgi:2-methylcitrate synthase/citrate synthase II